MTDKMKHVMIIMPVLLAIVACKKSEVMNKQTAVVRNAAAIMQDSIANPLNVYDSIGYWHNVILDAVLKDQATAASVPTLQTTTNTVIRQSKALIGRTISVSYFDTVDKTVQDRTEQYQAIIANASVSAQACTLLSALFKLINAQTDMSLSEWAVRKSILSWESHVIGDSTLPVSSKRLLLCASSVARYSNHYWSTSSAGTALRMRNVVKWIAAVTSDIAGAIVSENASYAADCSSYAYDLVNYSMP